jgi:hypothetical protein
MNVVEETALAQDLIAVYGDNAASKASERACLCAGMADDGEASKWRRVMALVAAESGLVFVVQDA